jgi:myo-inositol-1(or 4)-monophosphatase
MHANMLRRAWDVCAGVVIAREAGGRCYGRGGRPFDDNGEALMGHHFFVIRCAASTVSAKCD